MFAEKLKKLIPNLPDSRLASKSFVKRVHSVNKYAMTNGPIFIQNTQNHFRQVSKPILLSSKEIGQSNSPKVFIKTLDLAFNNTN